MSLQGCASWGWRGQRQGGKQRYGPSYWGRGRYVHLQRIHPSASDSYLLLENIWEIIRVLVT